MPRWRHNIETLSLLLALYEGNAPVADGFPHKVKMMPRFDVCFDVSQNEPLNKESSCRWFERPCRSCNVTVATSQYIYIYICSSKAIWKQFARCCILLWSAAGGLAMTTSLNGDAFRVAGPLWGESIGQRWIPPERASSVELWCFLWCMPEQTVEQTVESPVIWDACFDGHVTSPWWCILHDCIHWHPAIIQFPLWCLFMGYTLHLTHCDTIWRLRSGSASAQVMYCWLTASCHCLN